MDSNTPEIFQDTAATLRYASARSTEFLTLFASQLEIMLPTYVRVKRSGMPWSRYRPTENITISFPHDIFTLQKTHHGTIQAIYQTVSGGIVLKTEEIALDIWIDRFVASLAKNASHVDLSPLQQLL